jgi:hypothetical protein
MISRNKNDHPGWDGHFYGSGDPIRTDDRSGMKGKNAIAEKRSNYAKSG